MNSPLPQRPAEDWQQGLSTLRGPQEISNHDGPPQPTNQAAYNQVAYELMQSNEPPVEQVVAKKKRHLALIAFFCIFFLGLLAAGYVLLTQQH